MNTKSFLVCFIVVMLATSIAMAGTHQGSFAPAGGHFARGGTVVSNGGHWNGGNWNGGHWNGGNWGGNWHHHHHDDNFNNFVFVGGFGYPFFGYPYGYGYYPYGYGYPPYGYGYGYAPGYGYYGYGNGYYGNGYYGSGYYGNGYYGNNYYGNGVYRSSYYSGDRSNGSRSGVVRLQRQLSRAGYYRGPIDGIMGSRTHYALRAYQHDHGTANIARD
jgi:Putative peptidoglycan binding domain